MPLAHTRLLVVRFAECFRFYRDALQLEPSWGNEEDSYASFRQEQEDRIVLTLFSRQEMAEAVGTQNLPVDLPAQDRAMLIFQVEDVDETAAVLLQQGVTLVKAPADFPDWGIRCAYVRDPDGNLIEMNSELPPEAWSAGLRQASERWETVS